MAGGLLDTSRHDDAHTARRLTDELIVFSMAGTQKLRNIEHTASVALHLDTAAGGADVVLAEGTATVVDDDAVAHLTDGFAGKYAPLLGPPGLPAWRAAFSQPILVTVTRVVAWTRTDGQLAHRSVP